VLRRFTLSGKVLWKPRTFLQYSELEPLESQRKAKDELIRA
jgi:hypothetical protein